MMRLLLALLLVLAGTQSHAQTYGLGLEPAPPARYAAIPAAFSPLIDNGLPAQVDLSGGMPPPGKQADQSCVGWAVAYALKTYHEKKENNWAIVQPDGALNLQRVFSPAFVYNQINRGQDKGSNFGDAFHVLATQGAAPLSAMPYRGNPFDPVPAAARSAAASYKIDTFRRLNHRNPVEIKSQLAAGFPVIIGMQVYPQFETLPAGATWSAASGPFLGNHAMAVVGYDDSRQAFKVINSWGPSWSSAGYGWISYGLFTQVVNEAYIVVDLQGVDGQTPASADVWTPPVVAPQASTIVVDTNLINPNFFHPSGAVGMLIPGRLTIPAGVRGIARVVIPLTFATGQPVQSLHPAFALPSGQAAFGTPPIQLTGAGITNLQWWAFIPYCALNVPKTAICVPFPIPGAPPAQTDLRASPILFIDNFGVAAGQNVQFFVRL